MIDLERELMGPSRAVLPIRVEYSLGRTQSIYKLRLGRSAAGLKSKRVYITIVGEAKTKGAMKV